ncbi:hypothetical protein [Saccharothrix luteola]|nr:hypothetical protein [Saccharothrix luteola]
MNGHGSRHLDLPGHTGSGTGGNDRITSGAIIPPHPTGQNANA